MGFGKPGVCRSSCLLVWTEGAEGEAARGLRAAVGLGRSSSPSRDASSPSRANQWSKSLVASGLSTCPYFFSTCCFHVFMFLLLALLESAAPFHEDLTYTKEQARKQMPPKLKHHLQHKNARQLPRTSSPTHHIKGEAQGQSTAL